MTYAVKNPPLSSIYFVTDEPEPSPGLIVEAGAWIDIASNINAWPEDSDRPEQILCQSISDPLHYKFYKYRLEIDPSRFRETGLIFGGTFSKASWERFANRLPAIMAVHAISSVENF